MPSPLRSNEASKFLPAVVQLLCCVEPFRQRILDPYHMPMNDPLVMAVKEAFIGLLDYAKYLEDPYSQYNPPGTVKEVLARVESFQREFAIPTVRQHGNSDRLVLLHGAFRRDACIEVERFLYRMAKSSLADFSVFGLATCEKRVASNQTTTSKSGAKNEEELNEVLALHVRVREVVTASRCLGAAGKNLLSAAVATALPGLSPNKIGGESKSKKEATEEAAGVLTAKEKVGAMRFDQACRLANKSESKIKILRSEPEAITIGLIWPDADVSSKSSDPVPTDTAAAVAVVAEGMSKAEERKAGSRHTLPAFELDDVKSIWNALANNGNIVYPHSLYDHSISPMETKNAMRDPNTKYRYEGHIRVRFHTF